MTGTPSVNKLLFTYHALTLLFLAGFALYDKRHHRIRNAALLAFLPWCLFSPVLMYCAFPCLSPAYWGIRSALGLFAGFALLLSLSLATGGGIGGGDMLPVWMPERILETNASIGNVLTGLEINTALVTFIKGLELHPECRILVSKRNMIIPHVEENLDRGNYQDMAPQTCPCCGQPTRTYYRVGDKGRIHLFRFLVHLPPDWFLPIYGHSQLLSLIKS